MSLSNLNKTRTMGRKRTQGHSGLPVGVYQDAYGFYLRKPYKRLCGLDASRSEVWANFEGVTATDTTGTLRWLVSAYLKSDRFATLSPKTQHEARRALEHVLATKTKSGAFGDAMLTSVTPGVVRKYLDNRAAAPSAGNREVAYLSAAFSWGFERDMTSNNPCKGVRRFTEKPRELYVTDEMYAAGIAKATPEYLPLFMELAYLLYARKIEVLDLRRDDLLPEGMRMRRRKGSKDNVIRWSARLELAVNTALALPSTIGSMYLLHDRQGQPIKSSTLDTAWQRAELPFTAHDLKRKGLSEAVGGNPAGHKDLRMRERYNVKPDEVEPPR